MKITAADNSRINRYVDDVILNGHKHKRNYFTHKELTAGGDIDFKMASAPNTGRGTHPSAFPYSFSNDVKKLAVK